MELKAGQSRIIAGIQTGVGSGMDGEHRSGVGGAGLTSPGLFDVQRCQLTLCWSPGLAGPVLKKIMTGPKILTHTKAEVLIVLR